VTINYRDGHPHQIGPISLQFTGLVSSGPKGVLMPTGIATIASREGVAYGLDWLVAEAIAHIIAPSANVWTAKENSMALQRATGEKRGNLRIDVTNAADKLGPCAYLADKPIFMARLVTGAGPGEKANRTTRHRSTDYRRSAFRKGKGSAQQDSRREFIEAAAALGRYLRPDLITADWEARAMDRFDAADAFHLEAAAINADIEAEDAVTTTSAEGDDK
jgi:CheY-like chemotaxis protein